MARVTPFGFSLMILDPGQVSVKRICSKCRLLCFTLWGGARCYGCPATLARPVPAAKPSSRSGLGSLGGPGHPARGASFWSSRHPECRGTAPVPLVQRPAPFLEPWVRAPIYPKWDLSRYHAWAGRGGWSLHLGCTETSPVSLLVVIMSD